MAVGRKLTAAVLALASAQAAGPNGKGRGPGSHPKGAKQLISTVAVGTDGSDTAAKAVEFALDLASRFEAKIVFLSAYRPVADDRLKREQRDAPEDVQWQINPAEDVEPALRDAKDAAQERGLTAACEAKEGDPSKVLVDLASKHNADLLVIGNKGMQRKVLGSVPNTVSHKADCSV